MDATRLVCCWCGAKLGIDLLARDSAHAPHDHTVVLCQALLDHAQIPDELSLLDLALLDHTVLVDDEHIAAALVATKPNIGHEQRRLRPQRERERERNNRAAGLGRRLPSRAVSVPVVGLTIGVM